LDIPTKDNPHDSPEHKKTVALNNALALSYR
jgi:hypothetical protein